ADERVCTAFHRFGHSHCHAAIFERARGINALVLDKNIAAASNPFTQFWTMDQRRVPLTERNDGGLVADRKEIAIVRDDSPALLRDRFHKGAHRFTGLYSELSMRKRLCKECLNLFPLATRARAYSYKNPIVWLRSTKKPSFAFSKRSWKAAMQICANRI